MQKRPKFCCFEEVDRVQERNGEAAGHQHPIAADYQARGESESNLE